MRTGFALLAVVGVFGGIVLGGSQLLGDDDPAPAATRVVVTTRPLASTATASTKASRSNPMPVADPATAVASREWRRRANSACVRWRAETVALTARVRDARTIDEMIDIARLEVAIERKTIDEVAGHERLHTNRVLAHELTLVGRRYLRQAERVLDRLSRREILEGFAAGQSADMLRAQWGAVAGRLGATKCGASNDTILIGLALDRIGG